MSRVVELLEEDHRALRRILADLEAAVDPPHRRRMAGAVAALAARFELHRRKEDEIVFPALAGGRIHPGVLADARVEHRQVPDRVREIVSDLEEAERSSALLDVAVDRARGLLHTLGDHLWREEHLIFPILNATMPPRVERALTRRITELEKLETAMS